MYTLFGGMVEFASKEEYKKYIEGVEDLTAIEILEMSLHYAVQHGVFTLDECYGLYKCIESLRNEF
jgi:hypothetical protein